MTAPETKTRSFLKPVVGGIVLIALLAGLLAFRHQLSDALSHGSGKGSSALLGWIPNHGSETVTIAVCFLVAVGLGWIAHIVGRLRAWIFAVIVDIGLWVLFWNDLGFGSIKSMVGVSDGVKLDGKEQVIALLIVLVLSGFVFWILEAKESWSQYRHRQATSAD